MKRTIGALLLAALALVVVAGASARSALSLKPRTVVAWPYAGAGSFAESMTLGADGALYVSRTLWGETTDYGQIERVTRDGRSRTIVVPPTDVDGGLFAGVALGPDGALYVALATFGTGDNAPGVARVGKNGSLVRVLMLPSTSFPNGLAFHGGYLYVSDPAEGAIWRTRLGGPPSVQTEPWLQDPALEPVTALGPDGIAFRGDTLYVTQYDRGQILRVPLGRDDAPGRIQVLAQSPALVSADGIAFDVLGNLWVAVNEPGTGRLVVVTPAGRVIVAADHPSWLDYPTQPVFAPTGLYLLNGSFSIGAPSVVAFDLLSFFS
jgi:sugar lactone lactonase YvrE